MSSLIELFNCSLKLRLGKDWISAILYTQISGIRPDIRFRIRMLPDIGRHTGYPA